MDLVNKLAIERSWKWLFAFFVFLSFISFPVYAAKKKRLKLTPAGQKVLEDKLAAYPAFDLAKYTKEADQQYPLLKEGTKVNISYRSNRVSGGFYGFTGKYVTIGNKRISRIDLTQKQLSQFIPEVNAKMRQMYVKRQKGGYNAKKLLAQQKLIAPLAKQYPAVSKKSFARVFKKLKDRKLAEQCVEEILKQYHTSLPIPPGVSKKQFMRKILSDFLEKREDIILEGVYVVSLVERKRKEDALRKIEEMRLQKQAERIIYPRAATPVFSPDGGGYDSNKTVTITSSTEGVEIRYTLNNKMPTEKSPLYKETLKLKMKQRLKAVAFHPEYNDSDCAYMATWDTPPATATDDLGGWE